MWQKSRDSVKRGWLKHLVNLICVKNVPYFLFIYRLDVETGLAPVYTTNVYAVLFDDFVSHLLSRTNALHNSWKDIMHQLAKEIEWLNPRDKLKPLASNQ